MKYFIVLIGSVLLMLMLSSCSPIVFEPISCDQFKDCRETIKKVYSVQRPDKAPYAVEVTNEYIETGKTLDINHHVMGTTTSRQTSNRIYFKDIADLRVIHKWSRYEIRFVNRANRFTTLIFLSDKEYAIQGYSAIKCMVDQAKANTNDKI